MATTEPNTKHQHYVWRHYLNAWAADETFWCYRQKDKKLISTQPKSVAGQTYFYETRELTAGDLQFLKDYISKGTDVRLRTLNSEYVQLTQLSFKLRAQLKDVKFPPEIRSEIEGNLRWAERNLMERYHSGIENKCQDILDSLRNQDEAFYSDDSRCADFFYFIALQYFRTARMREGISSVLTYVPGHDPQRTAAILNHIHATNVGAGLAYERKAYRIVFLRNANSIPFIAGDQPVINMLNPKATNDLELYFPLTPRLAMVLARDPMKYPGRTREVTAYEVEHYNFSIYRKSEDQVYSNDRSYLEALVQVPKEVLAG